MWSGNVAFGLVHIPVKMYTATEDRDVSFHQVHKADGGRISYQRTCRTCGEVVPYAEIGRAYEDETGRRVLVSDEELEALRVSYGKDIEIVQFVPAEQVDPIHFDRAYYLQPATGAAKPYVLLRQALERTDRAAVAMVTIRTRTRLALLRIREDVLVLQTLLWPDEVREPDFAGLGDADVSVRDAELSMADSLVESLGADFEPAAHRDEYREAVLALVEQKLAGEEVIAPEAEDEDQGAVVVDLMAALQESVRRSKAARAQGAEAQGTDDDGSSRGEGESPEGPGDAESTEVEAEVPRPRSPARPRRRAKAGGGAQ